MEWLSGSLFTYQAIYFTFGKLNFIKYPLISQTTICYILYKKRTIVLQYNFKVNTNWSTEVKHWCTDGHS